jgi:energy-coupling factor transporter ATP-binding protein EcfA2
VDRLDDTADEHNLWKIRQMAGMVFQNPDNQIISSVVEEDVGFGPENLGVETDEIWSRVDRALEQTGMTRLPETVPESSLRRTEAARRDRRRDGDEAQVHRSG